MLKIADEKPLLLQHCLQEVFTLYRQGKLNPEASHQFTVDGISKAHDLLESGNSIGKVWIKR
jgi:D-arabinose 1-dehydrogenase-like Zn-dependent alcohol dehydrogenase